MYADFEYYRLTFGGNLIEEEKWPEFSRKADAFIDRLTFNRLHQGWTTVTAVKMATCAVAEEIFIHSKQLSAGSAITQGVKSENNDGYSVTYADSASYMAAFYQQIARTADLYLPPSHPLRYAGFYRRGNSC